MVDGCGSHDVINQSNIIVILQENALILATV